MNQDATFHGEDLNMIREWMSKQAHLPQKIDDMLLKRFLNVCDRSVERTKSLIDIFFTIRSQAPEIFDDRDPNSPGIQEALELIDFLSMPNMTKDGMKIFLYRLKNGNADKYNFINGLKAFFLFSDMRLVSEKCIPKGEIPIFDMNHFSLKHLTKVVLPVLKKYMVYTQEALPINLKEIHLINVPPFLDRCMAIIRPFMKNEVIYSHLPNSKTLFEHIPKENIPDEYGGSAGKCEDISKYWCEKLMDYREYLLDESRWKVDESKRANRQPKQQFGMEGSFRSLNID